MDITTDHLKPEDIVKMGDGTVNNYPKVIEKSLHHCKFKWYMMTGLTGDIWLCEPCASQLEYWDGGYNFTNGTFRVQHGEDMYMEATYFKEDKLPIIVCFSCGASKVDGCKYRIAVDEITYVGYNLKVFNVGDKVVVWKLGKGEITGWTDGREQYRRYDVTFNDGSKGKYAYWQMVKDNR